jgi:ABC-type polysaccharide/polyol phosphate export permease
VDDRTDNDMSGSVVTNAAVADAPPPELLFRRKVPVHRAIADAWKAREVTRSLTERAIRSRYKQAVLGFAWSILTPLVLMLAFTVVFKRGGLTIDTNGAPKVLFWYVALVVWTFFSNSITNASTSIIGNITLINKTPCPREVFPLSGVAQAAFDGALSLIPLVVLFGMQTFMPRPTAVWVPLILVVVFAFTIGASILCSVLIVYVRDLRTALPLALQFGLFATPIAYPFDQIPAGYRGLYSFLNPLGPTIDALRNTLLYDKAPQLEYLALGTLGAIVWLVGGYWLFRRMEAGIADIA